MWSSVASAGSVDPADTGKLVFIGGIAQLGAGEPVVLGSAPRRLERIALPTVRAKIRYPVQEKDLLNQAPGVWDLNVRYRDGNGSVNIQLIQVTMATGVEQEIFTFQSGDGYNRSNEFHNEINQATFGLNFGQNVYYVVVTLSALQTVEIGTPPALQFMQLGPA